MNDESGDARLERYKRDFCKHNRCTVEQFVTAFSAFMKESEANPDGCPTVRQYRLFAQKWNIRVIQDGNIPYEIAVQMSVLIAGVKMAAPSAADSRKQLNSMAEQAERALAKLRH